MTVYYAQRRSDAAIKIGWTRGISSLNQRMGKLRYEHGPLELLNYEVGGWHDEQARHRQFAQLWVTGEWFTECGQLLDHISSVEREFTPLDCDGKPFRWAPKARPETFAGTPLATWDFLVASDFGNCKLVKP